MKQINEGLDYHDMKGQIEPLLTVDEYSAKMGKDSEIVTLAFIVKSKLAGEDLTSWLEKGYDFILDAQVSDGELTPGKYLVFAELKRRTSVPEKIIDILEDLQTLTDMPLEDWTIKIKDQKYNAEESVIKSNITLSPHEYRLKDEKQEELNEFRKLADLPSKNVFEENPYTKYIKSLAGM
jgi:hypothetical protein